GSRQPQSLDLRVLESEVGPGFAVGSTRSGAQLGNSMSSGDIDGDGLRYIVAATLSTAGYGRAFVVFGKKDTKPVVVPPARGETSASVLTIICPPDELACNSVASGADANGDGLDDLLLGSVYYPLAPQ